MFQPLRDLCRARHRLEAGPEEGGPLHRPVRGGQPHQVHGDRDTAASKPTSPAAAAADSAGLQLWVDF